MGDDRRGMAPRAAARGPRGSRSRRRGASPTRSCSTVQARRGRARRARRGRAARRDRAARRARLRAGAPRVPAARRRAVPVDLRLSAAEQLRAAGRAVTSTRPLAGGWHAGRRAPRLARPRRAAVVIHTSGTTARPKPVELTYGNFLWSALGSAVALARPRRALAVHAAAVPRRRAVDPVRSAIYATTAVVHERSTPTARSALARRT